MPLLIRAKVGMVFNTSVFLCFLYIFGYTLFIYFWVQKHTRPNQVDPGLFVIGQDKDIVVPSADAVRNKTGFMGLCVRRLRCKVVTISIGLHHDGIQQHLPGFLLVQLSYLL